MSKMTPNMIAMQQFRIVTTYGGRSYQYKLCVSLDSTSAKGNCSTTNPDFAVKYIRTSILTEIAQSNYTMMIPGISK